MQNKKHQLVGHGFQVGHSQLTNFEFDSAANYTYCRICGAVYQSELDRYCVYLREQLDDLNTPHVGDLNEGLRKLQMSLSESEWKRKNWARKHARRHSDLQHQMLEVSRNWLTPEAAKVLAGFGIVPVMDMVLDPEVEQSLLESKPVPNNDAEG